MIIHEVHHELECIYSQAYMAWRQATIEDLLDRSHDLRLALDDLKRAGYSAQAIVLIERHATTLIERARRPIQFVDVEAE